MGRGVPGQNPISQSGKKNTSQSPFPQGVGSLATQQWYGGGEVPSGVGRGEGEGGRDDAAPGAPRRLTEGDRWPQGRPHCPDGGHSERSPVPTALWTFIKAPLPRDSVQKVLCGHAL